MSVVAAERAADAEAAAARNGDAMLRILRCEDFLVGLQPARAELAPLTEAQPAAPLQLEGA